jgi:hypothetical protein
MFVLQFYYVRMQALEHYTDLYDIKRAVVQTHLLNAEVQDSQCSV